MSRRLVCVMFGLLALAVFTFAVDNAPQFDKEMKAHDRLVRVLDQIRRDYVDADKTDVDKLINGAIQGMLQTLDPHSTYFTADTYRRFREETSGQFGGLGISISVEGGWLTVMSTLDDTPAARAGLRTGDKIVKIDGKSTRNKTVEQAVMELRGDPGTDVVLTVYRQTNGVVEKTNVKLTRAIIHVNAVSGTSVATASGESERGAILLRDDIGFIRLAEFSQDSASQLRGAINDLLQKGMKALVLDLRMNSGGLLDQAVKICSLFLPPGSPCVSVIPRDPAHKQTYSADYSQPYTMPLAVLVNHGSASASEIVAGAIQDHHRGVIVGPKGVNTYGKGTVQTVNDLPNGDGLKLTTARYYTPKGACIDKTGITPDIGVEGADLNHWVKLLTEKRIGLLPPPVRNVPGSASLMGDLIDDLPGSASEEGDIDVSDVFASATEVKGATTEAPVYDIQLAAAVDFLRAQMFLAAGDPLKTAKTAKSD
ncbi:S41 family peptidase [bacterium]|nr:S41 family peptidase [bacterium]